MGDNIGGKVIVGQRLEAGRGIFGLVTGEKVFCTVR